MEIRELRAPTARQWEELAAGEREPWGGEAEHLQWREKDRHVGVLAADGSLAAHAGSLIAEVAVGAGAQLEVIGIGGVFVTPALRGRGLVAEMLARLLAGTGAPPTELAMLFCRGALTGLYRRLGFIELGEAVWVDQPAGRIEMPLRTMWRPLRPGASWPPGTVELPGEPF